MPSKNKKTKAKGTGPPSRLTIRRNQPKPVEQPVQPAEESTALVLADDPSQRSVGERWDDMGTPHLAMGAAAGTLGSMLGVFVVGRGWLKPKTAAIGMMGAGGAAMGAGYYLDSDHLMAAGAGMTAAGGLSLVNQWSVDGYEAWEWRDNQKKAAKAHKVQSGKPQQRNARLTIIETDDEHEYEEAA